MRSCHGIKFLMMGRMKCMNERSDFFNNIVGFLRVIGFVNKLTII